MSGLNLACNSVVSFSCRRVLPNGLQMIEQSVQQHTLDLRGATTRTGGHGKVAIVNLGKMVVDPESADLTMEMNISQPTLSYDDMKERECKRLRRAGSRMGENPRRP